VIISTVGGVLNIVMSASVCPSVRLFVRLICSLASVENHMTELLPDYLCTLTVAVARFFSSGFAIRYELPVFWMTSYIQIYNNATCVFLKR